MLTSYTLDVPRLDTSEERIGQFQLDLNRWFASQSKGSQCKVHCFQEEETTILNIQRGSYLRTVARWKGDRIEIETFRPATEDLLVYSPDNSALTIKASLNKEREFYLIPIRLIDSMNLRWFDKLTTNWESVPPLPFALSLSKGPNRTFFKQNRYQYLCLPLGGRRCASQVSPRDTHVLPGADSAGKVRLYRRRGRHRN